MRHRLLGPVPLHRAVGIRVRVVRLVAVPARAIDPGLAVRARYLVDLPGIRVVD